MYIEHALIRPGTLERRDYQCNIAASCLERPTLVVLPTGLGKTAIALLVIADVLKGKGPKILFLAPTKPLVEQHASYLRNNLLNDRIAVFTGEVDTAKRSALWRDSDIVVSTPQVIVNDILGSKLGLEDVNLVIFDEAHRAVGDYAYVFVGQRCREKGKLTMGMTASPGSEPAHIVEVCENLNIDGVEIRSEYDPDVVEYVHDITVQWERVEMSGEMMAITRLLREALEEQVEELRKYGFFQNVRHPTTKDMLRTGNEIREKLHAGKSPSLFAAASVHARALKINHGIELIETQGPSSLRNYFDRLEEEVSGKGASRASKTVVKDPRMVEAAGLARHATQEHPKLKLAMSVVGEQLERKPDSRIIMFTHYRDTAEMVTRALGGVRGAKALRFVGQATRGLDKGLRQREQVEAIERFSRGEFNVLVATSVAEEGLDIPSTDLVVFYEPIPSEIRTIQRRGRTGRKRAGRVVILITKNSRDEAYYWASKNKEKKMLHELEELRAKLKDRLVVGAPGGRAFREVLMSATPGEGPGEGTVQSKGQRTLFDFQAKEEDRLEIVVDTRELNSNVVKELYNEGIGVRTQMLEVADYIVSDRVAVERKEVQDFIRSIMDGRLFQQARSMKREYQSPVLVIEGEGLFQRTAMHEKAIYGALASLVADFGLPLIFTKDEKETAQIVSAIAKREHREGRRMPGVRGEKGGMTLQERQRFVVESLPNVSGTLAGRLLAHFGTVKALVNASEEELMQVKGIGEATAKGIRRVLDERYYLAEKEREESGDA